MEQKEKFDKKIIAIEIELGFLRIPANGKKLLPSKSEKIKVYLGKNKNPLRLTWDYKNQRIYGLVNFYRKNRAKPGDKIIIEHLNNKSYGLIFSKATTKEIETTEITRQEAEEIIDLSGLSTQAKGDIVEDRIKELILLYGQGLLNVYKPTNDTEGIDLIIVKNGVYQPLFLQIKSNYKLYSGRNLLIQVNDKTLHPHHTLYVVGVYFDPKKLEINEKIALIPSEIVYEKGQKVKLRNTVGHRITISLKEGSTAKFTKYLVKKTDFVNKLLEKFTEIERYYK